nr:myomodulin isoform, SMSMLR amide [Lymnaea stagnalis, penis complex, Peptide, 7 aa] [Lymnaea stagnalis]
SMSMLRL